jgi:hypothetical protein
MGRCGSETLFQAIQNALPDYDANFYRTLSKVTWKGHTIIKTHDKAPKCLPCDCKIIYTHGNTRIIASSVLQQPTDWKKLHFYHFHKTWKNNKESLIKRDGLCLSENYQSWHDLYSKCALFIHYDRLFESADLISDYLGTKIELPKRTKRCTTQILVDW